MNIYKGEENWKVPLAVLELIDSTWCPWEMGATIHTTQQSTNID